MAKVNKKIEVAVRPQKRPNLPKAAVNILTKWLEDNCTNPYPTESTKRTLMEVTRLTKNQIYNWFINSRRRILPNILKEKCVDRSLILLRIKKYTCFNQARFTRYFENQSLRNTTTVSDADTTQLPKPEQNLFKQEDYNLQLLADVATRLPRIPTPQ
ncbi:homeobox protein PKNOX1-like [Adelges cooleyi]|uniref:homeobox protein PKNOX1-like n=1 Tax=Adelges cooleyi TaxID=133065 RepID=UPI00217FD031|nr:homeobox protein PKNOX1-like [Adelges cooleyi]XP_050441575.1 homeobox protein PKNOX1-like [Adelges cooleyi]XP_050441576.1 homeobox protein PKNOX1-like [Adelges cooleyi]